MGVTEISSYDQFQEVINSGKPVLIDFWAKWCSPCNVISPIFEKISNDTPDLEFYDVDVDEQCEISADAKIKALPTFILFNNGEKVDELVGIDPGKLKEIVKKAETSISASPTSAAAEAPAGGAIDRVYDQPMNCACDGDEKLISSEGSAVGNDVGFGEEQ